MKKYLEAQTSGKNEVKRLQDFYKEMLKIAQVSQVKLAAYIEIKPTNLSTMFKEEKLNYDLSRKLESIFNIPYSLWLDIQAKNRHLFSNKKGAKKYDDFSYDEMMG